MIAPSDNESFVVLAAAQGLITPCLSQDARNILAFWRDLNSGSNPKKSARLSLIREHKEMFTPAPVCGGSPDPDDDKFIACALSAKVDYLVAGNKRDFPEHQIAPQDW